ncbi:MAG: terpene cyclase/mutase family protein [Pirellulales bacterium]|nr:terpene cyclase/mutase family protein [Pirellulales bacterium]
MRMIVCILLLSVSAGLAAEEGKKTSPLAEQGPRPRPVPTPAAGEIDKSLKRGVEFLLKRQNKDGSWGSASINRPSEVTAPVPGAHYAFRAATTGLAISGLIEAGGDRAGVGQALDRAEDYLFKNLHRIRRQDAETYYNTWSHAYAIQALVRMLSRKPDDAERAKKIHALIRSQIEMLDRYEVVDGGWAYYDDYGTKKPSGSSMCFVTATVLVAFQEAQGVGETIPPRLIERAKASILRHRRPDFSYCYGEYLKYRTMPINQPGSSIGRSQACNYAMRIWGDASVSDAIVKNWLNRLFARNGWLSIARKYPIPHESFFSNSGYFFYYGHYYAALCIELIPPADRGPFQDQLAHVLLKLQEKDGSWWDYPLYNYHQEYGTAFALMALERCRRAKNDEIRMTNDERMTKSE